MGRRTREPQAVVATLQDATILEVHCKKKEIIINLEYTNAFPVSVQGRGQSMSGILSHYTGDRDAKTLFVKNLSYDTTKESLHDFFSSAVDVRLPIKDDGCHKG